MNNLRVQRFLEGTWKTVDSFEFDHQAKQRALDLLRWQPAIPVQIVVWDFMIDRTYVSADTKELQGLLEDSPDADRNRAV